MGTYSYRGNLARDVFLFNSVGPKGTILKIVRFDEMEAGYYNTALGDIKDDGTIDFENPSNNNDILTVLNTVASIIEDFSIAHPGQDIFIKGSDDQRSTAYQWRLKRALESLKLKFEIWGLIKEPDDWEPFEENGKYLAFLVVPVE